MRVSQSQEYFFSFQLIWKDHSLGFSVEMHFPLLFRMGFLVKRSFLLQFYMPNTGMKKKKLENSFHSILIYQTYHKI